MSKHAKHFSALDNDAMRVSGALAVLPAMRRHRASRARIGIAPAQSYAKVFHPVTRRLWTAADNLPQLPQLALKKLGQRKPNRYAVPQLPQPFLTCTGWKKRRRGVCGVRAEILFALAKPLHCATFRGSFPATPE
jgi:hypothetical protein